VINSDAIRKYVICETISPSWPDFEPLYVRHAAPWSSQVRHSLERISSEYVFWLQDDYWILEKLNLEEVATFAPRMMQEQIDYLRLVAIPPSDSLQTVQIGTHNFGLVEPGSPYRRSLQASIWRRTHFYENLSQAQSPWQFEMHEPNPLGRHFALSRDSVPPISYLATAITKGKWSVRAQKVARLENLDLGRRRLFSPLEEWLLRNRFIFWMRYGLKPWLARHLR
jgi:hypothetical protein